MNEKTREMAIDAIELHTDPRSIMKFRLSISDSIQQIANEEDIPDLDDLGSAVSYRDDLIVEITDAVEKLTEPVGKNEDIVKLKEEHDDEL